MNKILVTGVTGFVGNNLIPYLSAKGIDSLGVSRHKTGIDSMIGYDELTQDLVNNNGVSAFIHLAGKAHDIRKGVTKDEYLQANTQLTQQVYDVFIQSHASVFIYMSSVKAVTDHATHPVTEETDQDPQTFYGISKQMAEIYINSKTELGKRTFILRPCMIHGPGNKGNLNLLYRIAQAGLPFPLAAFSNKRSFLSVENLCFIISELLLRTDIPSGIYNIADNEPLSTNQVMEIINKALLKKNKLWRVDTNIIRMIAKIGDWIPLPLDSERLHKLTQDYIVDNRKILAALKKPLPLDVVNGLRKTIQSFNRKDVI